MMEKNSNVGVLVSIFAGAAAGFALGMMMAPKKGSDLRSDALGYLDDLNEKVCEIFEQGRDVLRDLAARKTDGTAGTKL